MIHRSISLSLSQYEGGGLQPLSLSKIFLIQCIAGHRKCMPHWNNKLQSWNIVHQHDALHWEIMAISTKQTVNDLSPTTELPTTAFSQHTSSPLCNRSEKSRNIESDNSTTNATKTTLPPEQSTKEDCESRQWQRGGWQARNRQQQEKKHSIRITYTNIRMLKQNLWTVSFYLHPQSRYHLHMWVMG